MSSLHCQNRSLCAAGLTVDAPRAQRGTCLALSLGNGADEDACRHLLMSSFAARTGRERKMGPRKMTVQTHFALTNKMQSAMRDYELRSSTRQHKIGSPPAPENEHSNPIFCNRNEDNQVWGNFVNVRMV